MKKNCGSFRKVAKESKGTKESEEGVDKVNKGYHKLLVWQRARELVKLVYQQTDVLPKNEEFGLKSQIRRAAVSVVLNIVEGHRRSSRKEFLYFLNIATGSLVEVEACLELCTDLQFLSNEAFDEIENKRGEVAYLILQLIKSLNKP